MKVYLTPQFGKETGQGGIKRVVETQLAHLPNLDVDFVDTIADAEIINTHVVSVRSRGTPVVFSNHGLYWEGYDWQNWSLKANREIVKNMRHPDVSAVTVPSRWVANALQRGMLLDPIVVHHGVDTKEWKPGDKDDYVVWAKNRRDLICDPSPLDALSASLPEHSFVSTFGKDRDNTLITGSLKYADSKLYIERAAIYLATVRETGGITVMEAMASGTIPLGYRWGVNREIITHKVDGYLVEPGDIDGLIMGLEYCYQNRNRMSEAARKTIVNRFQIQHTVQRYLLAYNKALIPRTGPKVSVIITAFNLEQYLPAAIESVLNQTMSDWELIIVEDNSPDSCGEIAERYASHDDRIIVIHNPNNVYLAEARNIGIRASSGKYIIPLDADDLLADDALSTLSNALDQKPELDVVTGGFELIEPDGRRWQSGWPFDGVEDYYKLQLNSRNMVPYASMYRKWVWEDTGGYRRRMKSAEDAEFWSRAFSFGAQAGKVTTKPTLIYNNRPESMSHTEAEPDWNAWFTWRDQPYMVPFGSAGVPANKRAWPVQPYAPAAVSVIVPVGPKHDIYLQDCLDSLVAQTFLNWEVILVNDTGRSWFDDDGNIVNPYLSGFPFAKIVELSEGGGKGPAWARNRGIEESAAPLLCFLDADDFAQPALLDALVSTYRKFGGWVYTDFFDQEGNHKRMQDWDDQGITRKALGPITGIYSREMLDEVGGFDENAPGWEDWNLHLSLLEADYCGSRIPLPLLTYRYTTGTRREDDFSNKENLVNYVKEKHYRLYGGEYMGCGCGKGGGGKSIAFLSANSQGDGNTMIHVRYIGAALNTQRMRSKAHRGQFYKYSATHPDMYVHAEDAASLLQMVDFEQVASAPTDGGSTSILTDPSTKPIVAARQVTTYPEAQYHSLDLLGLKPEVVALLKGAGYSNTYDLQHESIAGLVLIKGIGKKRAEQVLEAVAYAI